MSASDEQIDLTDLSRTLWGGRYIILLTTVLFTLIGVSYAFLAQKWYRAEVVLAPVDKQSFPGGALGGSGLRGLSGLASLAGVNLQGSGTQEPIAVLRSKNFARAFIEDEGLTGDLLKEVARSESKPDIRDAVRVFDTRVRTVTENTKTSLVTLSIRWKDADTAALWANTLAKRLNDRLRQQAAEEAERNVAFLKKEMAETSIVSLQQSLGSLLEGEMQKLMLARANDEFAFKVIDRAVPPKQLDAPKRVLIILVAFMGGVLLSVVFVIVRKSVSQIDRRARLT
jgi:uncharacterized protein involved in exopolysaccharide biosynthesis